MTKQWANTERVELGTFRGPQGSDRWRWWWLSLGLLINRHCAEAHDDSLVSEHLDHVWNTQRHALPFPLED